MISLLPLRNVLLTMSDERGKNPSQGARRLRRRCRLATARSHATGLNPPPKLSPTRIWTINLTSWPDHEKC